MNKVKLDHILMVTGFLIAMYIGLYISAISIVVYITITFIAMLLCGVSCREENPIYKFLDYTVGLWIGAVGGLIIITILLLFAHDKLNKQHILKQPAIVGNKVCGMENDKLVCYAVSNISDKVKYKIKKDKSNIIVNEYIQYNVVDKPINKYYTIGEDNENN